MGAAFALLTYLVGRQMLRRHNARRDRAADESMFPSLCRACPWRLAGSAGRGGNAVDVELLDRDGNGATHYGLGRYRSLGGLCLEVENPLAVGTIRSIRVCRAPEPRAAA